MSLSYYDDQAIAFFTETVDVDMTSLRARFLAHLAPGDYLRRIAPRVVRLKVHETDRYGRKVAEVIDPASGEALNLPSITATAPIRATARPRPAPRPPGSVSGARPASTNGRGFGGGVEAVGSWR